MKTTAARTQTHHDAAIRSAGNSMSVWSFLIRQAVVGAVILTVYRIFCFQMIERIGAVGSEILFWLLTAGGSFLLAWGLRRRKRSYTQIGMNVLLPIEIYMMLSDRYILRDPIRTGCILSSVAAVCILGFVFCRKVSDGTQPRRQVLRNRVLAAIGGLRTAFCILFAISLGSYLVTETMRMPVQETAFAAAGEKEIAQRYADVFTALEYDNWAQLDAQARLRVLKKVVQIEQGRLGIQEAPSLSMGTMDRYSEYGNYRHRTNTIRIAESIVLIGDAKLVVFVICHEMYHCFQYNMIDALHKLPVRYRSLAMLQNARLYDRELADYVSPESDHDAYKNQACEKDATLYGQDEVELFAQWIDSWKQAESPDLPEGSY